MKAVVPPNALSTHNAYFPYSYHTPRSISPCHGGVQPYNPSSGSLTFAKRPPCSAIPRFWCASLVVAHLVRFEEMYPLPSSYSPSLYVYGQVASLLSHLVCSTSQSNSTRRCDPSRRRLSESLLYQLSDRALVSGNGLQRSSPIETV